MPGNPPLVDRVSRPDSHATDFRCRGCGDVRELGLNDRQFEFEWDEAKAAANLRKHGVPFDLASTVFKDPQLLTVADLEHSEHEERWFSVGRASDGAIISVVYVWWQPDAATTKIRLISARNATHAETRSYQETL